MPSSIQSKLETGGLIRIFALAMVGLGVVALLGAQKPPVITVHWDKATVVS
jgi:hypothetical protein